MNIYCDHLQKYQRKTVQRVIRHFDGSSLLALDMGLGKTVIGLSLIQELKEKTLIVCPASLKYNWVAEIEKFWPGKTPYICCGRKPPGSILSKVDIFICNYEILQYWKHFFIFCKVKMFIADESHFLKEKSAKRTKAAMVISNFVKYRVLLTGTPIENKPIEIWSQLAIINKSFFPSWLLFAKKFNGAVKNNFGWQMTRATNTKELNRFLTKKCMIRIRKEEVLNLPPIIRQVVPVEIKNRAEYDKAEEDIIAWLRKHNTTGLDLEKTRKAEAQVKLDKLKLISAKGKLDQVAEWVNGNSPNFKIVLFCYHREILSELHLRIKNHVYVPSEVKGIDRQNCVKRFQTDDSCRVFLTTVRVGGTGFTLTASDTSVFVQLPWTSTLVEQAIARTHRIGTKAKSVNAIFFVSNNTVEQRIIKLLDTKAKDFNKVVNGNENENDCDQVLGKLFKDVDNDSLVTSLIKQFLKGEKEDGHETRRRIPR